jgi:hypothetical protein
MNLKHAVDWIHLGQYRVRWRAVVRTVMNLRAAHKWNMALDLQL